jgi:hypothetical protein
LYSKRESAWALSRIHHREVLDVVVGHCGQSLVVVLGEWKADLRPVDDGLAHYIDESVGGIGPARQEVLGNGILERRRVAVRVADVGNQPGSTDTTGRVSPVVITPQLRSLLTRTIARSPKRKVLTAGNRSHRQ